MRASDTEAEGEVVKGEEAGIMGGVIKDCRISKEVRSSVINEWSARAISSYTSHVIC